jgi:hydroxyethylthiazole kinase-like sugar kinase family protein
MSAKNSENLIKTKKELQDEIDKIENLLGNSVGKVKSDISSFDPRRYVRKNPLAAMGIAVAAGFLVAASTASKKKKKAAEVENLTSALVQEIKRVAVRQVAARAGRYIEKFLDDL